MAYGINNPILDAVNQAGGFGLNLSRLSMTAPQEERPSPDELLAQYQDILSQYPQTAFPEVERPEVKFGKFEKLGLPAMAILSAILKGTGRDRFARARAAPEGHALLGYLQQQREAKVGRAEKAYQARRGEATQKALFESKEQQAEFDRMMDMMGHGLKERQAEAKLGYRMTFTNPKTGAKKTVRFRNTDELYAYLAMHHPALGSLAQQPFLDEDGVELFNTIGKLRFMGGAGALVPEQKIALDAWKKIYDREGEVTPTELKKAIKPIIKPGEILPEVKMPTDYGATPLLPNFLEKWIGMYPGEQDRVGDSLRQLMQDPDMRQKVLDDLDERIKTLGPEGLLELKRKNKPLWDIYDARMKEIEEEQMGPIPNQEMLDAYYNLPKR